MSRAMSRINSLRNSLNPFHRLPPEIISRCFHILASMEPPMYKEVVSTRIRCRGHVHLECVISLGWIKVTHVCGTWRCVALGDPTLWQDLSFFAMRPRCFSTISRRSKSLPLSITCRIPPFPVVRELFTRHYSRVQSMRLYGGPLHLGNVLRIAREPSPVLKSLSLLYSAVDEHDDGFDGKALDGIKADQLFPAYLKDLRSAYSGSVPSIFTGTVESLTLVGFPFPGPPLHFTPKLTSLVVSLPAPSRLSLIESEMRQLYPSLGQFLDVLEGMTTLTSLDLRYCSPYDVQYDPSYPIPRTASLPWLENLTLVNMFEGLMGVLMAIQAPNARLRIGLYGDPDDDELASVFDAAKCSCGRDIASLRSLYVHIDTDLHKRVTVSSSPVVSWSLNHNPHDLFAPNQVNSDGPIATKRDRDFAFALQRIDCSKAVEYSTVISVVRCFTENIVEHLSVQNSQKKSDDVPCSRRFWSHLTENMINLRHLSIEYMPLSSHDLKLLLYRCTGSDYWDEELDNSDAASEASLGWVAEVNELRRDLRLQIPKLAVVKFRGIKLSTKLSHMRSLLELRKELVGNAKGRVDANAKLQKITFDHCGAIGAESLCLDGLRALVEEVVVMDQVMRW
ncbi:uncharacterized protein STEHIDRAFT_170168 [Stereum hirsutum FP-91666 SS1]|uniref:uncharacterized protein n=1 Tax=Stereum hirsutum (strain FP-91666) TaxID=721885 RepID=UPI0004449577|nr:uncharacterized protein STEHIDRAFT_170168 [Stereum hirsutum FP-91666 SS1]EIM84483.1 hypothetical protein STEHIDRAFT_170168 [Stereum hirsutum FP-91666 SS1]